MIRLVKMEMEIIFADVIKKRAKKVMHIHLTLFTTVMILMNVKLIPVHVHSHGFSIVNALLKCN